MPRLSSKTCLKCSPKTCNSPMWRRLKLKRLLSNRSPSKKGRQPPRRDGSDLSISCWILTMDRCEITTIRSDRLMPNSFKTLTIWSQGVDHSSPKGPCIKILLHKRVRRCSRVKASSSSSRTSQLKSTMFFCTTSRGSAKPPRPRLLQLLRPMDKFLES